MEISITQYVDATEELLHEFVFRRGMAEVIFCELHGKAVGYALYFTNFSTFAGRPGLYLEDLYVQPQARGQGCGKALLRYVAAQAVRRGCARVDWECLNWNTPSQAFYTSLGAVQQSEWLPFRLEGDALAKLAGKA